MVKEEDIKKSVLKSLKPFIIKATENNLDKIEGSLILNVNAIINRRSEVIEQNILKKMNVPEILGEIRKENARMKEELFIIREELFKTAKEVSAQLFNDASFTKKLTKHFDAQIRSSIDEALGKKGLTKFIRSRIDSELKTNFFETVRRVVETVFNKVRKSSEHDLKVTKDLLYSVDAEIKHFSMRAGFSAETEKMIIEKLDKKLDIATKTILGDLKSIQRPMLEMKNGEG